MVPSRVICKGTFMMFVKSATRGNYISKCHFRVEFKRSLLKALTHERLEMSVVIYGNNCAENAKLERKIS